MSYTPTTWANGDVITAEKLNNMESGIENAGGGGLIVTITAEDEVTYVMDKTYTEIKNALVAGMPVVTKMQYEGSGMYYIVTGCMDQYDSTYSVMVLQGSSSIVYSTSEADGYPDYYFGD